MNSFLDFINNKISLNKENFYTLIIGLTPSQGARSPKLWNKVYKKKKSSCRMYPADVSLKKLGKLINYLKSDKKFLGGSVTAPYKIEIMKYLDEIDLNAKNIGSVNTIVKKGNKIKGFNTDYFGAFETLKKISSKKNILIIGAGGASKAVILASTDKFKKSNFYFFNRKKKKLNFIKKTNIYKKARILGKLDHINLLKNIDLFINTTSIGFDSWIKVRKNIYNLKFFSPLTNLTKMVSVKKKSDNIFNIKNSKLIYKDKQNLENFFSSHKKITIFDIIYKPKKTKLLRFAEKYSKVGHNGLEMNLFQAVKGFVLVNRSDKFNKVKKVMENHG